MSELITAETTKEKVLEDYKSYPSVNGSLVEKPFYEARYAPIFFEIPMGSKVLDCGVNDGVFSQMLKEKRKCDVTGIDISEVALEEARKKGLNVQVADVENLPFEDETFDIVLGMELLSHLFDPEKAVSEMARVLKKKGAFLGSCPHSNLEKMLWEEKRMHRRYYDENELFILLDKSFYRSHMKVLTGGQFSFALAGSFIGDKPAEILFKCGKTDILGWDSALLDRSKLRCWFGATQTPGTVYYRMTGFADKMQKLGAEVHYNPYDETNFNSPAEWASKIRYIPSEKRLTNVHIVHELETLLKASDLSVFQLTNNRDIVLVLTTARKGVIKKPMLVEMDDWIFDVTSYNMAATSYRPNSEAEAASYDHIKLSDAVIVSTDFLREKVQEMFPGKIVYVIKNSLDFDIWDKVTRPAKLHDANPDLIRIGYTGCSNHSGDLELIVEPMKALLNEFPNLEFTSLPYPSTDAIDCPRYKRVNKWVVLSLFPQEISDWELDIGIAPLRDNNLNRAKSNLRWLEYSALKVPTIASNVYPFKHSITNGKDGVIVSNSQKDWYESMKSLILDGIKRKEIGQASYKTVKKFYNMDQVSKTYLSVLKNIKSEFLREKGTRA